jgi:hypothetical protein
MLYVAFRGLSLQAMGALLRRVDYRRVAVPGLCYAADLTLRCHDLPIGMSPINRTKLGEAFVASPAWTICRRHGWANRLTPIT